MVSRREFLASATGAAGILAKNAAGYDTVRIDGELRLIGADKDEFYPCDVFFNNNHLIATDRNFAAEIAPGVYNVSANGTSLRMKRIMDGVELLANEKLVISAVSRDFPDKYIDQYRQMCTGIDAPNPGGGNAINPGNSVRLQTTPRIVVIRSPGISDAFYNAITGASNTFPRISGGEIKKPVVEFAEYGTRIRNIPGVIFVSFEGKGAYSWSSQQNADAHGWLRGGAVYLLHERDIAANWGLYRSWAAVQMLVAHEFGHQMGLDHTDKDSFMSPYGRAEGWTRVDIELGAMKYMRQPRHVLTYTEDRDAFPLRAPDASDPVYYASRKESFQTCNLL